MRLLITLWHVYQGSEEVTQTNTAQHTREQIACVWNYCTIKSAKFYRIFLKDDFRHLLIMLNML